MKSVIRSLFAAASIFMCTANVWAEDMDQIICNNCAEGTLKSRALDLGNGNHYFYDFVKQTLTHYLVQGITNPRSIGTPLQSNLKIAASAGAFKSALGMNGTVTLVPNTAGEQAVFSATQAIYNSEGTVDLYALIHVSVTVDDMQSMGVRAQNLSVGSSPASNSRQATAFDVVSTPAIKAQAISEALSFGQNGLFGYFRLETGIAVTNWVNLIRVNLMGTPVTLTDRVILNDNSYFDMAFEYQS